VRTRTECLKKQAQLSGGAGAARPWHGRRPQRL